MPDSPLSIEELLANIEKEIPALPPGTDLAAYINKNAESIGALLARRIAEQREAASKEADFSPSALPEMPQQEPSPTARKPSANRAASPRTPRP